MKKTIGKTENFFKKIFPTTRKKSKIGAERERGERKVQSKIMRQNWDQI